MVRENRDTSGLSTPLDGCSGLGLKSANILENPVTLADDTAAREQAGSLETDQRVKLLDIPAVTSHRSWTLPQACLRETNSRRKIEPVLHILRGEFCPIRPGTDPDWAIFQPRSSHHPGRRQKGSRDSRVRC